MAVFEIIVPNTLIAITTWEWISVVHNENMFVVTLCVRVSLGQRFCCVNVFPFLNDCVCKDKPQEDCHL